MLYENGQRLFKLQSSDIQTIIYRYLNKNWIIGNLATTNDIVKFVLFFKKKISLARNLN
jgi:hypothetical protein